MCITRGYNISKMEGVSLADATQDLITLRTPVVVARFAAREEFNYNNNNTNNTIRLLLLYQGRRRRGY